MEQSDKTKQNNDNINRTKGNKPTTEQHEGKQQNKQ